MIPPIWIILIIVMHSQIVQKIQLSHDNLLGKFFYKWSQKQFKLIIRLAQFQQRGNGYIKKLKIPSNRSCTLMAYSSGCLLITGCNNKQQMKQIVNQLLNQKINILENAYINFAQNLQILNMRTKVDLGVKFDIRKCKQYLDRNCCKLSRQKNMKKNKSGLFNKLYIPSEFYKDKQVVIYLMKNSQLQIFKSHLIEDMHQFVFELYSQFLSSFVRQKGPNYARFKQKKEKSQDQHNLKFETLYNYDEVDQEYINLKMNEMLKKQPEQDSEYYNSYFTDQMQ